MIVLLHAYIFQHFNIYREKGSTCVINGDLVRY